MADRLRRLLPFVVPCAVLGIPLAAFVVPALAETWPQSALVPRSDVAALQDRLFDDILIWVTIIFVVVQGALVVTVLRFRRRPGGPEARPVHGNTVLEIAWTIAPAIILAFIAVPTVRTIFRTAGEPPPGALEVRVVGHQWWWEFHYPELRLTTANELHLPQGRPIKLTLESVDVIHSFWVPAFGGKRDLIPGRVNHMWFTPGETGTFPGQCAEFCGASHANMYFKVISQTPAEFDAWVAQQKAPVATPDSTTLAAQGLEVYRTGQCVACHMIDGVSYGVLGPNLSKVGTRTTLASGMFPNDEEHMARWLRNAPAEKPGSLMPGPPTMKLTDEQVQALVAYLRSLR